jgi:hypothetical protein
LRPAAVPAGALDRQLASGRLAGVAVIAVAVGTWL